MFWKKLSGGPPPEEDVTVAADRTEGAAADVHDEEGCAGKSCTDKQHDKQGGCAVVAEAEGPTAENGGEKKKRKKKKKKKNSDAAASGDVSSDAGQDAVHAEDAPSAPASPPTMVHTVCFMRGVS